MQVRSITLDPHIPREGFIWEILVTRLRGDPVLPALRKVTLSRESSFHRVGGASVPPFGNDTTRGALWLISPSVHQLSVSLPEPGFHVRRPAVQKIVELACSMAPDLHYLRVRTLWPINFGFLHGHKRLHAVTIYTVTNTDALEPLTTLPCLEDLSLAVGGTFPFRLAFPRVRFLALRGSWSRLNLFIDETDLPQLRSFSAFVIQRSHAQVWYQSCGSCFQTLSIKHTRLTTLDIKCRNNVMSVGHIGLAQESGTSPFSLMVEPLLALHKLRDVSLLFGQFTFPYSSSDIQSFAESWPSLESFRLEFVTQDEQRAGFESVVHFAHQCPRLRSLQLPGMELTRGALEGIAYPEGQHHHPLREFRVAQVAFPGGLDLSREVIQFTQRVFPHVGAPVAAVHRSL